MVKKALKKGILFIVITFFFFLSMVLCCCFPSDAIEENVIESSKILLNEGMYIHAGPSIADNGVDALIINAAYSVDNKNPVVSALTVRKNYNEKTTVTEMHDVKGDIMTFQHPKEQIEIIEIDGRLYSKDKRENIEVEGDIWSVDKTSYKVNIHGNEFYLNVYNSIKELDKFLRGEVDTSVEYARYWHGYLPIIRVMLLFMNIQEIRILTMIVMNAMLIYFLIILNRNFGKKITIIIGFSLIFYNYIFIGYTLSAVQIFAVMMLASIILIKKIENKKDFDFNTYMLIVGMLTNFMDYLTVPLVTFGLPMIIYLLHKKNESISWKEGFILLFKAGIMWGLGYTLTFFSKWVIVECILGRNMISSGIEQIFFRTTGDIFRKLEMSLSEIIIFYLLFVFMACLIVEFIFLMKYKFCVKKDIKQILINNIPMFLIGVMPVVWHIVLANHTQDHWKYHYRDMFIVCISFLIVLNDIFELKKRKAILESEK